MSIGKALYLLARQECPETIKKPYRWFRRCIRSDSPPAWSSWLAMEFWSLAKELDSREDPPPCGFDSETLETAWRIVTAAGSSWANRFLVDEFASGGIQCRFPFLDRRLFDLVFSVPPHLRPKCRGRPWFKPYIAQGLAAYIPPEIQLRDAKVDFESYNCFVFNRCSEFLRPCLFDEGKWVSEPFVSRNQALALFQFVRQEMSNPGPRAYETKRRMETLRNIAGLELWLRYRQATQDQGV
jgi:hypothetical protein